jgi:hypothetical protein
LPKFGKPFELNRVATILETSVKRVVGASACSASVVKSARKRSLLQFCRCLHKPEKQFPPNNQPGALVSVVKSTRLSYLITPQPCNRLIACCAWPPCLVICR